MADDVTYDVYILTFIDGFRGISLQRVSEVESVERPLAVRVVAPVKALRQAPVSRTAVAVRPVGCWVKRNH